MPPFIGFANINTMDSSTNDVTPTGSALQCARGVIPNVRLNSNTTEAVNSFLAGAPAQGQSMLIFGHGYPGFIATGNGNTPGTLDQMIAYYNGANWIPQVRRLFRYCSSLTLLGCDVGADQDGANLLYSVAQICNCPVTAATYLVWCQDGAGLYLDMQAQWITATPSSKPAPIPKPGPNVMIRELLFLYVERDKRAIDRDRILGATIDILSAGGRLKTYDIPDKEVGEVISHIAFDQPIESPGKPLALLTGYLHLYVSVDSKRIQKNFAIYNGHLLQDLDYPSIFYEGSAQLDKKLLKLGTVNDRDSHPATKLAAVRQFRSRGYHSSQMRSPALGSSLISSLSVSIEYCDGNCDQDSSWYTSNSFLFTDRVQIQFALELVVTSDIVGKQIAVGIELHDPYSGNKFYDVANVITMTDTDQTWAIPVGPTPPQISNLQPGQVNLVVSATVIQAQPVSHGANITVSCGPFLDPNETSEFQGAWSGLIQPASNPFANMASIIVTFAVASGKLQGQVSGDTTGLIDSIVLRSDGVFTAHASLFGTDCSLQGVFDSSGKSIQGSYYTSGGPQGSFQLSQ